MFWAADEAGLYLQATTSFVWSTIGQTPIVRADPGRKPTHFYGALNLTSGKEIVLRSDVMSSEVSAQFLLALLEDTPQDLPIFVFWDRAPWHFGEEVKKVLSDNPRLQIIFFPTASPDLNPQEHVWKAARKKISHNHLETKLPELADRFLNKLNSSIFKDTFLTRYGYNAICPMFI